MSTNLANYPVSLPTTAIAENVDASKAAESVAHVLGKFYAESFDENAVWRDTFAVTGTQRTFYGASTIATAWQEASSQVQPTNFVINSKLATITRLPTGPAWIDVPFVFETQTIPQEECSGVLSIVPTEDKKWKVWLMRTVLEQLKGYGDVDKIEPKFNAVNRVNDHAPNEFDVVIVGGGHAGLSSAGRLQALGLNYVILEKNKRVGDSWKLRYSSAKLHTIREYSHLPSDRTFTDPNLPEWLSKDELAEGYYSWAKRFGINVWLETTLVSGKWDASKRKWSLIADCGGAPKTLEASHIIFATGAGSQRPVKPNFADEQLYKGIQLHSVNYRDAFDWKGKHGIVVGTANTAHDVAEDMVEAGLKSVTMLQRSKTYVLPVEHFQPIQARVYNEDTPTELSDSMTNTGPIAVGRLVAMTTLKWQADQEPERFDALERRGFRLERYGDITNHIYERMGGHYMDIGACAKIIDGRIRIKSDSLAVRFTENGLAFDDGSELPADVIVFATGFCGNLRDDVRTILGDDVADKVSDFWGLDDEGEPRGAYRPSGREYDLYETSVTY